MRAAKAEPESQHAGARIMRGTASVSKGPGRLPKGVRSFARRIERRVRGEARHRRLSAEAARSGPPLLLEELPAPVQRSHAARARLKESS